MPVEIRVPTLGESVAEATIGAWLKKPGDTVAAGEPIVSLETDKVNVEIEAEAAGVLGEIARKEGETVGVGEVLGTISDNGAGAAASAPPAEAPAAAPPAANGRSEEPPAAAAAAATPVAAAATPVARQIAEQNQVDLSKVKPSDHRRIKKGDVADYIESRDVAPATAHAKAREAPPAPPPPAPAPPRPAPAAPAPAASTSGGRPEERVPMSRRRQTIARRLVEAQHNAAMLTTFNEVDMTAVMEIRKRRRDSFKERHGVGLGFMSFFTRAAIGGLKAFPLLNAEIDGTEILLKRYYDIGVAVSTEEGLVVPVLRDADKKSFAQIEQGIIELATRAREGKLTIPELTGGTFTITNGGIFGSLLSTPILNAPQVGILGMHKIQERPLALNGEVVIRPMMYLALSYDHRIVDGREAVQFLVRVKELIEDPEALLLEG